MQPIGSEGDDGRPDRGAAGRGPGRPGDPAEQGQRGPQGAGRRPARRRRGGATASSWRRTRCSSTWSRTGRGAPPPSPRPPASTPPRSAGRSPSWSRPGWSSGSPTPTTAGPACWSPPSAAASSTPSASPAGSGCSTACWPTGPSRTSALTALLDRFNDDFLALRPPCWTRWHRPQPTDLQTHDPGALRLMSSTTVPDHSQPLTHRQILTILTGLMAGMFLAALDQTIVATSIRTIADDLHGLSVQAWATTAYLITATISTPLYGKLSDLYGRRPFFIAAISIFVVGSLLCGFVAGDVAAGRVPRGAGPRRRRPLLARADHHRRHRAAAGARQVPGLLPRRLRHLERPRPGRRRLPGRPGDGARHRRLALGLPRSTSRSAPSPSCWSCAACTCRTTAATTRSTGPARSRWSPAWCRCCCSPSRAGSGAGARRCRCR